MESTGECCVISHNLSEREEAPQVTLIQKQDSPLPYSERKKEETPSLDGSSDDSGPIIQGRLLSLTPTSNTSSEGVGQDVSRPETNAVPVGLKKWFNNGGDVSKTDGTLSPNQTPSPQPATTKAVTDSNAAATSPPQISPKLVKVKVTKEERERQRVEKEKEKAEAKAKREEEKEKKKQEKQRKEEEKRERQRKREQEIKERQEKREREEQEKKERREKREAEKQRKEDEKKKKEEEKKQMEMEKEQAKEEKLRKAQQAQKRIVSFFHILPPKDTVQNKSTVDSDFFVLTPFPTKPDVKLATLPRPPLEDPAHFDRALSRQDSSHGQAYFEECKHKPIKISIREEKRERKEEITCDKNDECTDMEVDDDVIITSPATPENNPRPPNVRYKLLQFHTNHRPAYFGTWRKKSEWVSPRNPFKKDTDLLDYEVDSDDEWEEEEPGESLSDSEGEDAGGESGDDDEEEDGFFVPHGYLSDSEGDHSGDEGTHGQDNQDLKQQKQVSKAKAWEAEFARKCQPLRAIKIGCIWTRGDQEGGVAAVSKEMEFLQQFEAVPLVELPIAVETKGETTADAVGGTESNKLRAVPEEAMPDLIRLVHKNSMGLTRLMKTFRTYWGTKVMNSALSGDDPMGVRERSTSPSDDVTKTTSTTTVSAEVSPFCKPKTPGASGSTTNNGNGSELEIASGISKRQLEKKIQAIATKEVRPPTNKYQWYVHDTVLEKYGIDVNALSPLLTSPSTASPAVRSTGSENGNSGHIPSPQTPCGSGVTRKRKPKGVKSLFDFVNSSSPSSGTANNGGKMDTLSSPSVKQTDIIIMEDGANTGVKSKSSKPLATLVALLTNNAKVVLPSNVGNLEPPLKKPRLELNTTSPSPKCFIAEDVTVIHSDSNDKENDEDGGMMCTIETVEQVTKKKSFTNNMVDSPPPLQTNSSPNTAAYSPSIKLLQE